MKNGQICKKKNNFANETLVVLEYFILFVKVYLSFS